MAAGIAGTVGGLYFVVTQDFGHGPGHDEDHHAETHETHGANEGQGDDDTFQDENNTSGDKHKSQGGPADDTKNKSKKNAGEGDDNNEVGGSAKPTGKKSDDASRDAPKDNETGEASPDKSDKPNPRGQPKSSNETSGKQEGLSNADTHHSTAVSKDETKSKKGEGVAETAKLKGTVSTDRPGAENKEERGKAQSDKDA